MDKEKRKEYCKKHYEEHKIDKCKNTIDKYCDELIRAYIYKIMRIYIICVLNIYYGERRKIQEVARDYIEKNY